MIMHILEALISATVLFGYFGILFKQNLIMKILAMDVMSTGVVAYFVLVAARGGLYTPIVPIPLDDAAAVNYSDPVPQAVILTAIVIGFSIQALMLVGVMKLAGHRPTLECRAIESSAVDPVAIQSVAVESVASGESGQ